MVYQKIELLILKIQFYITFIDKIMDKVSENDKIMLKSSKMSHNKSDLHLSNNIKSTTEDTISKEKRKREKKSHQKLAEQWENANKKELEFTKLVNILRE